MGIDREKVKRDLTISTATLDKAVDEQSGLVWYYGKLWADAQLKMRQEELNLKVVKAKLKNMFYEADPKVTGDKASALIRDTADYEDANNAYIEAAHEFDTLDVIMRALIDKRNSINNKVKMFLAELYPEVKQSGSGIDDLAFKHAKAEMAHGQIKKVLKPFKGKGGK